MYEGNGFKRTPQMKHRPRKQRYVRMNRGFGYLCPKCRDIIMYDRQEERYFCWRQECEFSESKDEYKDTLTDIILTENRRSAIASAERNRARADRIAARSAAAREARGFVYYLGFRDAVKIGTTIDLANRVTAIPCESVLAIEPGGVELEKARHVQFAQFKIDSSIGATTEWFHWTDAIGDHVDKVRADNAAWLAGQFPDTGPLPWTDSSALKPVVVADSPQPTVG